MGMNQTPSGNRIHIGFFGRRNVGKSSLVNAVTGQEVSVVSDTKGTTTDPVYKSMELLPLGPVMIIDTPGMDDEGELGTLRVEKTRQVLRKTDIAVLVVDATLGLTEVEEEMMTLFERQQIPYALVWNKIDLMEGNFVKEEKRKQLFVSVATGAGIENLKNELPKLIQQVTPSNYLVSDLLEPLDLVVLVVPIDEAAPKGRLILPQQQVIREALEAGAVCVVVKDTEYREALEKLQVKPKLVITDSQVFGKISKDTPEDILLTSFSILMARYKGFLKTATEGVKALENIVDGDKILIAEGCTHHRQCGDIGTVKIPNLIRKFTGKEPEFAFSSGMDFPADVSAYKLIIHCGGCMLNEREMHYRMQCAVEQQVPFTNYGIAIAWMNDILDRSLHALQNKF